MPGAHQGGRDEPNHLHIKPIHEYQTANEYENADLETREGPAIDEGAYVQGIHDVLERVGRDGLSRGDPLPFGELIGIGERAVAIPITGRSVPADRPIHLVQDGLIVDMDDPAVQLIGDALCADEIR